nr:NAD-dependent epimerase/dehydratase family protein [Bacteroidota bacterium]
MKIAITGASGHVGNCLCRKLAGNADKIKVLLHKNEDKMEEMDVEIIRGSILDKVALVELCRDVDVVYHLAAIISIDNKDRNRVYETNVSGTRNVIEICKAQKVKKLVYFSTIHTLKIDDVNQALDETNPIIPDSKIAYESSKAEAEKLVLKSTEAGLDASISAASKGRRGERYILSGVWLSLKELAEKIELLTAHKTPKFVAPTILAKAGLPFIHTWAALAGQHPLYTAESLDILLQPGRNISNLKAMNELGFIPRPIEETIADTFDWFEQNILI